jgi:alpha-glucosidase
MGKATGMSNDIFSTAQAYRFIKVEDYFSRYKEWQTLGKVVSHRLDIAEKTLILEFQKSDGQICAMLIQFLQQDIFRVRFRVDKKAGDYTDHNTRSAVRDTFKELREFLEERRGAFQTNMVKEVAGERVEVMTEGAHDKPTMHIIITYEPFQIEVMHCSKDGKVLRVWKTAYPSIYYTNNGDEYAIIQAVNKPATAKYIGFGEQGGKGLYRNVEQLNYFNYDNMRYRQIYNQGPTENREPLYHSDPFFMEFNGAVDQDSVYGIFIDNVGQICMDIGNLNSGRYMFGIRFGDLDYYFMLGCTSADIIECFTSIVGKERLKPRYVLGYHQGCYGYEDRGALEWVVRKYREHQIPLDGLHVDIDIQKNYQTFTIDQEHFPNPQQMFANLRAQGVKCSTNVTPIISNRDENYQTYKEGRDKGYFVRDYRYEPGNPDTRQYQNYNVGHEQYSSFQGDIDTGQPYVGEVYYGGNRGTTGHYTDLGRREVRDWWGKQYQALFDMGLDMVWQDMTTPAIRDTRGDMKGFPFRLLITDDHISALHQNDVMAIKVWNLYSYNLHKATYHGLNNLKGRDNKRNFIIGRGSFAGMHRFAGLWTGDNASGWAFLFINVCQVLSVGMCGLAICGQDIGGFEKEQDWEQWASPELLMRWTAAGAFLPWFRNHYIRKGQKAFQEPFMYVDWFEEYGHPLPDADLYRKVLPICKHYIELRYRLLQLFYDAMFENVLTGMPICRPMFLNDPQDHAIYNDQLRFISNQFFVRKDLLVAPLVSPQSQIGDRRDVYLPAGSNWYSFMDNTRPLAAKVEGGTTVRDFYAPLEASPERIGFVVPLYVREGAILPTIELEQYVGERNAHGLPNPITLNIYPGASGAYTLYLDDGVSRSSAPKDNLQYANDPEAREEYRATQIQHTASGPKTRQITVTRIHDNYTPKFEHYFFVAILHDPGEATGSNGPLQSVSVNNAPVHLLSSGRPEERADRLAAAATAAWYHNENINTSFLKIFDDRAHITVDLAYT